MLTVSRDFHFPASVLWELLSNPVHWPKWGPSIREVETRSLTVGVRGRVKTVLGAWLGFEVTEYVEGVLWRWKVASVPATGHRVESLGPARCRVTFEVPTFAAPYLMVCAMALRNLDRLCAERGLDPERPRG